MGDPDLVARPPFPLNHSDVRAYGQRERQRHPRRGKCTRYDWNHSLVYPVGAADMVQLAPEDDGGVAGLHEDVVGYL